MTVLRRAYVEVEPDVSDFDKTLKAKLQQQDPGGKAGKQIGGQLNRALKRFELDPIDVKADPRKALAAIDLAERKLRELSGKSATVEVKVQTERALGQLSRFRKQIGDVGGDAAPEFASSFSQKLGPLLAKLDAVGPLAPVLAGAAVAAAPIIGGVIAGAVIGGVGIGGVAGGLALAAKDPRVKAAADGVGQRLQARLQQAAGSFVEPAIAGLGRIEAAVDRIDLDGIFRDASRFVEPLAQGVSVALEALGAGAQKLVAAAGPVIDVISNGIADLGGAVGDVFAELSDNGVAAATALRHAFQLVEAGIRTVGVVVNALVESYGFLAKFGAFGRDAQQEYLRLEANAKLAKAANVELKGSMDAAAVSAVAAGRSLAGMAEASERLANQNLSAAEASLRLRDATAAAGEATDKHQKVSRAEESALLAMARATNTSTKAADEQGRSVDSATRAHERNRQKLIETAEKMGYSSREAKKLADRYLAIPTNVNTSINQPGMPQSREQTKKYDAQLDALAREIKTSITVKGDREAYRKLEALLIQQRALKTGTSVSAAASAFRKQEAKAFYAGGRTGDMGEHEPAGVVHGKEMVFNAKTVRRIDQQAPGFLDEVHATGGLPGYAGGGRVLNAPFPTTAAMTRIPSAAEALSAVGPSGGRTSDFIVAAARALVPGIRVLSKDRPGARTLSGNTSYHSLGRAVDFEPSEKLARLWNDRYKARTKELISPYQQYNLHNGQRHTYTGAIWNQHNFAGGNAHDHIAMAGGGVIGEPVAGVGLRSGNSYSFGERGPETVTPGVGRGDTYVFHITGPVASKQAAEDMVLAALDSARRKRKIR